MIIETGGRYSYTIVIFELRTVVLTRFRKVLDEIRLGSKFMNELLGLHVLLPCTFLRNFAWDGCRFSHLNIDGRILH